MRNKLKTQPGPGRVDSYNDFFALEENLNASFTVSLKELEDRFAEHPSLSEAWTELKLFLRKPGKRVRPLLFLSSCHLFSDSGHIPPQPVFRLACALEIFHAFALVHDDIIDQSHSRRGAPSLHIRLEKHLGIAPENAGNLALVIGDILFGYAMECFLQPGLDTGRSLRAARYFLRIAQDTGFGQAVEIAHLEKPLEDIDEAEILQTYYLKTTRYTIESPLVLGAMLAGASEETGQTLRQFAQPLGLAFQIENDLHEIDLLPAGSSELAYDLQKGVKTLFLKKFHQELDADGRAVLQRLLAGKGSERDRRELRQLLAKSRVSRTMRADIGRAFKESQQVLGKSRLSRRERTGLSLLVDFLGGNSHHSEAYRATSGDLAMNQ